MTVVALLTACSSSKGDEQKADDKPAAGGTTSAPAPTPMSTINATQVVAGLTGAGYKCTPDVAYVTCTSGATSVGILTGSHPRPPVVSLHAAGPVDTSSAEIAKVLPQVLELAHVNQGGDIVTWFGQQKASTAQMTAGDWLVEYSAEVDTDEPGTNLTLTDKLCKVNCQAE
ncbi:hypothetical protein AB0E63_15790 [Kribbella sp. NPDC026596]|uniref:hypothetical protein n=1 Tax=Kribbella sp. NPDC026596 TaxID=3155122 RepID=UPI0033CA4A03